jgi:hypothetical protein
MSMKLNPPASGPDAESLLTAHQMAHRLDATTMYRRAAEGTDAARATTIGGGRLQFLHGHDGSLLGFEARLPPERPFDREVIEVLEPLCLLGRRDESSDAPAEPGTHRDRLVARDGGPVNHALAVLVRATLVALVVTGRAPGSS